MHTMTNIVLASLCFGFLGACQPVDDRRHQGATESNLTAGMAKITIQKGVTSQAEVMEVFGPPDLVTHRDGQQIWTYDKISYEYESSGGRVSLFRSGSRFRSSSVSTMMILYFSEDDIVRDYRMSVVRF